jgi:hypothetical protein
MAAEHWRTADARERNATPEIANQEPSLLITQFKKRIEHRYTLGSPVEYARRAAFKSREIPSERIQKRLSLCDEQVFKLFNFSRIP